MGEKRYCISCMKEIASSLDDVLLCSDCGGPAEEPASLPTFLDTPPLELSEQALYWILPLPHPS